jgi:hypothetical protein
MSATIDFYRARAAQCAVDALAADLDNVRERFLRSQVVWEQMADRLAETETMRSGQTAAKAALLHDSDA